MEEHFDLENRRKIFNYVTENPGTHLRRISRDLDMAMGTLRHHLDYFEKHGVVFGVMENNLKVYFSSAGDSWQHRSVAPMLQQKRFRDLLLYVLVHPGATPTEIAESLELKSPTLSKYTSILEKRELVRLVKEGRNRRVYLVNEDIIVRLLLTYRRSYWDSLVDSVLEIYFEQ